MINKEFVFRIETAMEPFVYKDTLYRINLSYYQKRDLNFFTSTHAREVGTSMVRIMNNADEIQKSKELMLVAVIRRIFENPVMPTNLHSMNNLVQKDFINENNGTQYHRLFYKQIIEPRLKLKTKIFDAKRLDDLDPQEYLFLLCHDYVVFHGMNDLHVDKLGIIGGKMKELNFSLANPLPSRRDENSYFIISR